MDVFRQVCTTIDRFNLVAQGDSVLVALSGGPDSVALFDLLLRLRRTRQLALGAVHINHGIRPRAGKRDELFCRELCEQHEIDLTVVAEDIPALARRSKKTVEEAARDFRYGVFDLIAEADGYNRVALGHNRDDRVETILFRMLRGTGPAGLGGMPVSRERIVRPLFDVAKADILEYLKVRGLAYCIDKSNESVQYSRNFIRHRFLPMIRERVNPKVDSALLGLSQISAEENAYLEAKARSRERGLISTTPGGKLRLLLERFNKIDKVLRYRILRHCWGRLSRPERMPDRGVVERLDAFARDGARAMSLPDGIDVCRLAGEMVLYRRRALRFRRELEIPGSTRLVEPAGTIRAHLESSPGEEIERYRNSPRVRLDYNCIEPPLEVRSIDPGDRFCPLGLGGSKKIGNFLTDRKVPRVFRDEIPVVCDRKGIIWLVGLEIDDRVRRTRKTRKVLRIDFSIRRGCTSATG